MNTKDTGCGTRALAGEARVTLRGSYQERHGYVTKDRPGKTFRAERSFGSKDNGPESNFRGSWEECAILWGDKIGNAAPGRGF